MSDHTLPGDTPDLLRRCSPIVDVFGDKARDRGVVVTLEAGGVQYAIVVDGEHFPTAWSRLDDLALDLDDPTGRIHALWWWDSLTGDQYTAARERAGVDVETWVRIATRVRFDDDLTPTDITVFCRVMRAAVEVARESQAAAPEPPA